MHVTLNAINDEVVLNNLLIGIKIVIPKTNLVSSDIWWICQGGRIFLYPNYHLGRYHSQPYLHLGDFI
jgi:hypothetical protein